MHSLETIKKLNGEDLSADFSQPILLEERNRALMAEAHPYDVTDAIIAYEQGELDIDGELKLFQNLVDTGLAWKLQGSYGRAAIRLIEAGAISDRARG